MFDIGGWEFLIVIVIAIVVIGPKDLPGTIRTVSGWIRRARELAREFQSGLDDLARETDVESVKNDLQAGLGLDEISESGNTIRNQIEENLDPHGEIAAAFKDEDGPFEDNSFEEDEDIDGADLAEFDLPDKDRGEEGKPLAETDEADFEESTEVPAEAVKKA